MSQNGQWLYLIRHAHAEPTLPDRDRALSTKGIASAHRLGRTIAADTFSADTRAVCSELRRSRETAEILLAEWQWNRLLEEWSGLAPEDDPMATAETLNTIREPLIIVGHNPHLSYLAAILITGSIRECESSIHIRKSSAMALYRPNGMKRWSREWDSNPRPTHYECVALPD